MQKGRCGGLYCSLPGSFVVGCWSHDEVHCPPPSSLGTGLTENCNFHVCHDSCRQSHSIVLFHLWLTAVRKYCEFEPKCGTIIFFPLEHNPCVCHRVCVLVQQIKWRTMQFLTALSFSLFSASDIIFSWFLNSLINNKG